MGIMIVERKGEVVAAIKVYNLDNDVTGLGFERSIGDIFNYGSDKIYSVLSYPLDDTTGVERVVCKDIYTGVLYIWNESDIPSNCRFSEFNDPTYGAEYMYGQLVEGVLVGGVYRCTNGIEYMVEYVAVDRLSGEYCVVYRERKGADYMRICNVVDFMRGYTYAGRKKLEDVSQ